ncbi:hypothetical protein [Clavibacter michiganensis]|uniref:hypothetical protein n=1 Tax=Clavibacter michiganensis TaxID=28447 RepID=UPI0021573B24|nr:hypothetical protein [Clavibacter michiganensis]
MPGVVRSGRRVLGVRSGRRVLGVDARRRRLLEGGGVGDDRTLLLVGVEPVRRRGVRGLVSAAPVDGGRCTRGKRLRLGCGDRPDGLVHRLGGLVRIGDEVRARRGGRGGGGRSGGGRGAGRQRSGSGGPRHGGGARRRGGRRERGRSLLLVVVVVLDLVVVLVRVSGPVGGIGGVVGVCGAGGRVDAAGRHRGVVA